MKKLLLCAVAAAVVACQTSPLGRRQLILVSNQEMAQMGAAAFTQLKQQQQATDNKAASRYVQCVADAVLSVMGGTQGWEVVTFEDKAANAFALPGRKIGVYTGMLKVAENQDQLAAVMGHEVAHVLAGHSAERVSEGIAAQVGTSAAGAVTGVDPQILGIATNVFFLLPHSRTQEAEADVLGLRYMADAGFDPREAPRLWQNMRKQGGSSPPEILSTHPSDETRINGLTSQLDEAMPRYEKARAAGKRPKCAA